MTTLAAMEESEQDVVREDVRRFIQRKGHGAIGRLSDRAHISRQHLLEFRNGGNVSFPMLESIRSALRDLWEEADGTTQPITTAESVTNYTTSALNVDPNFLIAADCDSLASILRSAYLTPRQKFERFEAQIMYWSEALRAFKAAVEEFEKNKG